MTLYAYSNGLILGQYKSSTGSTGTYAVVGAQAPNDPTQSAGQPVALAIDWHSVVAGPADNSWHWASGLSGQISLDANNTPSLVVAHAMVATAELSFQGGAIEPGTYIDKLTYTPVSTDAVEPKPEERPGSGDPIGSPLAGNWSGDDGSAMTLKVYSGYDGAFGWVQGTITNEAGTMDVASVTDINAAGDGLALESVAVTFVDSKGDAIALAGTLDLSSKTLVLTTLMSVSTLPSVTYAQTSVSQTSFVPAG
jgi:hypothetical protein